MINFMYRRVQSFSLLELLNWIYPVVRDCLEEIKDKKNLETLL